MKDEKYLRILNQAVRLDVAKGHLKWTIAELARASGVTRPLIYHYFGKSKDDLIGAALDLISEDLFGLSDERLKMWRKGQLLESVKATRDLLEEAPHLRQFYFHWRDKPSKIQAHLVYSEKRYLKKLQELRPGLSTSDARVLFGVFLGLVIAPELEDASLDKFLRQLKI